MKPAGYLIGASTCAGPYRIANCLIEERMVYTNKIPCGHMRAPGDPQGFFANESQLDIVARKLGMEPAEFKRKNMLHDGDETPIGGHISHIRGDEALDKAIQLAGSTKPSRKMSAAVWPFPNGVRAAAKAPSLSPSKKTARSKSSRRWSIKARAC